jgi:hypothetical protein
LARDLLTCPSARAAETLAAVELDSNRYAGCNIVCADHERLVVLEAGEWLRVRPLPPGLHVLANRDVDDEADPRVAFALSWLSQADYRRSADCVAALTRLCAQRGSDGQPPMCLRSADRGTVSSSIVGFGPSLARSLYLHAQGPPDRTPYLDYSHLLGELVSEPTRKEDQKPWESGRLTPLADRPTGADGDLPCTPT